MFKQRLFRGSVTTFLFIACSCLFLVAPWAPYARAAGPPPQFTTMPGYDDLQNDSTQWNIFHDQGYTQGRLQNIQPDKGTMKVTLMHGSQSYADILAYRDLPAADTATQFMMDVSFLYHDTNPAQGMEFTMDKWVNGVRWEWALQWQIVPDGSSLAGAAQSWRVWNGSAWQPLNVTQNLTINTWHTLHLYGEIVNNQVHYIGFKCDMVYTNMSQLTFNSAASSGDKLGVGVQLDGNFQEISYPVYYRSVGFHYQ